LGTKKEPDLALRNNVTGQLINSILPASSKVISQSPMARRKVIFQCNVHEKRRGRVHTLNKKHTFHTITL
jgi:hypothetical protein